MDFIGVESNLDQEAYNALMQHEKNAINAIEQNGLYF